MITSCHLSATIGVFVFIGNMNTNKLNKNVTGTLEYKNYIDKINLGKTSHWMVLVPFQKVQWFWRNWALTKCIFLINMYVCILYRLSPLQTCENCFHLLGGFTEATLMILERFPRLVIKCGWKNMLIHVCGLFCNYRM